MKRAYVIRGGRNGSIVWNCPPLPEHAEVELVPKAEADGLAVLLNEAMLRLERVEDGSLKDFLSRAQTAMAEYGEKRQ